MVKRIVPSLLIVVVALGAGAWSGPAAVHAATGPICYVGSGAVFTPDGNSWLTAWPSLQTALGDVHCTEIWVKAGVYKPGLAQTDTFNIRQGVAMWGGFAGGETTRIPWPATNVTILSGDIDNNDVNTDGNQIDETAADIVGNNSYHVVTMDGRTTPITGATFMSGFTITGGHANGVSPADSGGGLWCRGSGATGACSPSMQVTIFSGNKATNNGGAIFFDGSSGGSSLPDTDDVTFSGNTAGNGGAVYYRGGTAVNGWFLNAATFRGNHAVLSGGAIYNDGSGTGNNANPWLTYVTLTGNSADDLGGAIYNSGLSGGTSSPQLTNVILWGDTGVVAGNEMYNEAAAPYIRYSVIQGACEGITGATCAAGNRSADPKLDTLKDNGGLMPTIALLRGSSAINAADPSACNAAGSDQRGFSRLQGPRCDIGAFEALPFLGARADFDFNGVTEISVFRPGTRGWYAKNVLATIYGLAGDIPVPADYDGDGDVDVAVFRPSAAGWYVQGQFAATFGLPGDIPVPGDYDGDHIAELAVYRPSTSQWFIKDVTAAPYGLVGDIPVPGDYDGNGTTDIAVYRPSTTGWFIRFQTSTVYGLTGDIPVPRDYDGNGATDIAVYRPSTSAWYIRGQFSTVYGTLGDIPVPADYDGNGANDVAVYRPATSGWFIRDQSATVYGLSGDYPLPAPDTNADGDPYQ